MPQLVATQGDLGFGKSQFPGGSGIFDRGQRAGAGATIITGNGNAIGISLGHTRSNGADTRFGNQFDGHISLGIDLLQIKNELSQIFNGVNIVVGRGADQGHAFLGITQPGNDATDFVTGQLTPFTGFGSLGNLDLQFFGIDRILWRHAKTPRSNLLDFADLVVVVAGRIFAAFTRVGAPTNAVHGDRQGFVGFRRQCPQRHGCCIKTRSNGFNGLHFAEGDGLRSAFQLQQIPQVGDRTFVDQPCKHLVILIASGFDGCLQALDDIRMVGMILTPIHIFQ